MAGLNVAEAGAMSRDMPYMAKLLILKMKIHPEIDINRDWKVSEKTLTSLMLPRLLFVDHNVDDWIERLLFRHVLQKETRLNCEEA